MQLVIFGASGDLAQRKLYPALKNLFGKDKFPSKIIGISRKDWDKDAYRQFVATAVGGADSAFLENFEFLSADFSLVESLVGLKQACDAAIESAEKLIFYYAVEPNKFGTLTTGLADAGILHHPQAASHIQLVIEKPFGTDYASAQRLFTLLHSYLPTENIFLTDHVLNQEGLLDLIELKRYNPILSSWLTNKFITQIQITYSEKIGIEGRGSFYEGTGAIKDMFQSHLCELVSLILADSNSIGGKGRAAVLKSLTVEQAQIAQYRGYREEENVAPDSKVETYLAGELRSSLPEWSGVPILLRVGKKLTEKFIDVHFIAGKNVLTIRLVPNSGINLRLWKGDGPDEDEQPDPVDLSYCYRPGQIPDPYTQVLSKAFAGEKNLFVTMDEVLTSWELSESFSALAQGGLEHADKHLEIYESGSVGPESAAKIPQKYGTNWIEEDYFKFCKM